MPLHIETYRLEDTKGPNGGVAALKPEIYLSALRGPLSGLLDGRAYVIQLGKVKAIPVKTSGDEVIEGLRDYQLAIRYWLADPDRATADDIVHASILRRDSGLSETEAVRATHNGRVFHPDAEGWRLTE